MIDSKRAERSTTPTLTMLTTPSPTTLKTRFVVGGAIDATTVASVVKQSPVVQLMVI